VLYPKVIQNIIKLSAHLIKFRLPRPLSLSNSTHLWCRIQR